jgi:Autographiviridae endonuclease VII
MPYRDPEAGRLRQREKNRRLRADPVFRAKERERANERRNFRRANDPVFRAAETGRCRKHRTGWSPVMFERAWEEQAGKCTICDGALKLYGLEALSVTADHCRSTGRVRGLLCNHCNRGLGLFADDPARLARAAGYVSHHRYMHEREK